MKEGGAEGVRSVTVCLTVNHQPQESPAAMHGAAGVLKPDGSGKGDQK